LVTLPSARANYCKCSVIRHTLVLYSPLDLFFAASTSTSDPQAIEIMTPPSISQVAFGVQYLPGSVKVGTFGQGDALGKLGYTHTVRYIRLQWVDYTNTTRYRIIPRAAFFKLMSATRPGIGVTKAAFGLVGASLAPGFSGTGEYLYVPDLSSLRQCGYASGHVSLMGWFEEKLPNADRSGREDAPKVPLCPRGLLRDVVKYVCLRFASLVVDNRWSQQRQRIRRRFSRRSRDRIHSSQVNGSCHTRDLCFVVGIPGTALGFSC
jgi:hypothetical protein